MRTFNRSKKKHNKINIKRTIRISKYYGRYTPLKKGVLYLRKTKEDKIQKIQCVWFLEPVIKYHILYVKNKTYVGYKGIEYYYYELKEK